VAGTRIGAKKKVFGKETTYHFESDLLLSIAWMPPPNSFLQKSTAGLGKESSRLETPFGSHGSKNLDLDFFSFVTRIDGLH